ncbi:MAG TPA: patatin-like phospholipase family protein [Aquabacterium sp.]|uniref:patatin-like phospholipase family protein n=1 Tax=Aquabacterium sp. TaxID=1872578 RepID=UPI002E2F9CF8|nr:patatin-like phospholipase family protein [Aquabacterium sp.]HEX5357507.1 patatin-like phospholipase family protein [Aquabacterium sp.]
MTSQHPASRKKAPSARASQTTARPARKSTAKAGSSSQPQAAAKVASKARPQAGKSDSRTAASARNGRPRVNLALQGGGSHGAFTWGVLDRLLDDDGLDFAGLSGTSAGALNGAVLLSGYVKGFAQGSEAHARKQAQKGLHDFWRDVSQHGPLFSPLTIQSNGLIKNQFNFDQFPAYQWLNLFMRSFSPYEFNPLNLNPLKDVLRRHVDVDALHTGCQHCGVPLFVTATSVHTGQARVFTAEELSLDALMASACLPFVFQAVEIDGEPYWDGGYTGNPALYPLIYNTDLSDVLLVRLTPLRRDDNPTRSIDIIDRLSEITFNASLIGEMRAISFVKKLLKEEKLELGRYKNIHMHMVADDKGMLPYNASSKFNTDWAFLQELHHLGHRAAHDWLTAHKAQVGHSSTFDIDSVFLTPGHKA